MNGLQLLCEPLCPTKFCLEWFYRALVCDPQVEQSKLERKPCRGMYEWIRLTVESACTHAVRLQPWIEIGAQGCLCGRSAQHRGTKFSDLT